MRLLARASLLLGLLAGCPSTDVVARLEERDGGAAEDAAAVDANAPDGGFCAGEGPLVLVGDGPRTRCGGSVAETTFRYAICTCDGLALSTPVETDAFDSRVGPWAPGEGGGSVGTNGALDIAARASIDGSLIGAERCHFSVEGGVTGTLRSGGELGGGAPVAVGKDAFVAGDVRLSALDVGGVLTLPAEATLDVPALSTGETRRAPVSVTAPCDCAEERLLDVGALVAAHEDANDDAALGIDPDDYANGGARTLELDCGKVWLSRIGGEALTIVARGRVALFVGGDLALEGPLEVRTEGEGEIDLFVAGNVVGAARWMLGDPAAPARVRLYVGGSGTVDLAGGGLFAGNVYAPRAELVTPSEVEVFGSLFVRRLVSSGGLRVHYDRAVLDAGDDCAPSATCTSCLDCGNQACVDGTCGLCRSDADCCSPLVCAGGVCVPEPF